MQNPLALPVRLADEITTDPRFNEIYQSFINLTGAVHKAVALRRDEAYYDVFCSDFTQETTPDIFMGW